MAHPTSRPTILIADDDEDDRLLLEYAFSKAYVKCQLRLVGNGEEAITYLLGKRPYDDREAFPMPSLVLLDLKMPMIDGYQVLEWLQTRPELKILPVVVHSGSMLPEDMARTASLGAKDYHVKSFTLADRITLFQELAQCWLAKSEG